VKSFQGILFLTHVLIFHASDFVYSFMCLHIIVVDIFHESLRHAQQQKENMYVVNLYIYMYI